MNTRHDSLSPVWPTEADLEMATLSHASSTRTRPPEALGSTLLQTEIQPAGREAQERERKIDRYLENAGILSHQWLNTEDRQKRSNDNPEQSVSGFSTSHRPHSRNLLQFSELRGETAQHLLENNFWQRNDIYELCTVQPLSHLKLTHSNFPNQPLWSVVYEAAGPGYHEDSTPPREGNILRVTFVLPKKLARELIIDAHKDPTVLREMSERYMLQDVISHGNQPDGTTAWDRYARPPWEKWDNRKGGSVIAFRTSFEQPAEESRLVRFAAAA